MNIVPEHKFYYALIELSAHTKLLVKIFDDLPGDEAKISFERLLHYWEQLITDQEIFLIDTTRYFNVILEIERDHRFLELLIKRKSSQLFDKPWLDRALKKLEWLNRFGFIPQIFSGLIFVLNGILIFFPAPKPLLPDTTFDTRKRTQKPIRKTVPVVIDVEQTPNYKKFFLLKLILHQGALYRTRRGMIIELDAKFQNLKDINCLMQITFWFADGKPIIHTHNHMQAKVEKEIRPTAQDYDIKKTQFFMSYTSLGLGNGLHKCRIRVNVIRLDTNLPIGNPDDVFFALSDPAPF